MKSARQPTLFEGARIQMNEAIELTIASLEAYGSTRKHWAIAWSGGKDSTALLTIVLWLILSKRVSAPKTLTINYADTRMELTPLWLSAAAIREELEDKREAVCRGLMAEQSDAMGTFTRFKNKRGADDASIGAHVAAECERRVLALKAGAR